MSTTETATPATPAPTDAAKSCCGKSCCSKKGCGTNGNSCCCCGCCLGYTGSALLTATGLTGLYFWLTKLWPIYANTLQGMGRSFSSCSQFFHQAGCYLGLNWFALPLVLIAVVLIHCKCCRRCAPRLLFTYGLILTIIALAGLICSGVDLLLNLPPMAHTP